MPRRQFSTAIILAILNIYLFVHALKMLESPCDLFVIQHDEQVHEDKRYSRTATETVLAFFIYTVPPKKWNVKRRKMKRKLISAFPSIYWKQSACLKLVMDTPFKTSRATLLSSDYMKENVYLPHIQLPISIDRHFWVLGTLRETHKFQYWKYKWKIIQVKDHTSSIIFFLFDFV